MKKYLLLTALLNWMNLTLVLVVYEVNEVMGHQVKRFLGLGHNSDVTLLDCLADHSAITPTAAGIHLKEQFDELFSRNDILEQQKIKILKLESDLKVKSDDVIALSANLKQLSDRTDLQVLMNENKTLLEDNLVLTEKIKDRKSHEIESSKSYVLMSVIAIVGLLFGRMI